MVKALALIPARNEADSLPAVIASLRADQPGLHVLVVDDASSDATGRLPAALGVEHLRLCQHLGVGGAIRAGTADYVIAYSWKVRNPAPSDKHH